MFMFLLQTAFAAEKPDLELVSFEADCYTIPVYVERDHVPEHHEQFGTGSWDKIEEFEHCSTEIVIQNTGGETAEASAIELHYGHLFVLDDGDCDDGDTILQVPKLTPGASKSFIFSGYTPAATMVLDCADVLEESNEDNQIAAGSAVGEPWYLHLDL